MLHLDSAAAGRSSPATLQAVASHAQAEADSGGYVAQEAAGNVVEGLRHDLAGLLAIPAEGVAFVESGTAALSALLGAWPLPYAARVGVLPSEWGPNLESLSAHGLVPEHLPVEPSGRLDLAAFERVLKAGPPNLVHLVQLASHRGLEQPVTEAADLCRRHGVPIWVDATQTVGHVRPGTGAAAIYGTSRKWLAGPRGVGFLGIDPEHWKELRLLRHAKTPGDTSLVGALESDESHIAGRVGLANAVREFLVADPDVVVDRLDEMGRMTRAIVAEVAGWEVVGDLHSGAITSLRPTAGQDVAATRTRLLIEHLILTTSCYPWRAPGELMEPVLRLSPHLGCTPQELEQLAAALAVR